jgi:hypothetical protein
MEKIIGVKGEPDIIDIIGKDYNGTATSKGCQRRKYQN